MISPMTKVDALVQTQPSTIDGKKVSIGRWGGIYRIIGITEIDSNSTPIVDIYISLESIPLLPWIL
jgi:hypothetical protein